MGGECGSQDCKIATGDPAVKPACCSCRLLQAVTLDLSGRDQNLKCAQTLPVQNTSLSAKKITGLTSIYGALGPLITNLQSSNHIFRLNSYLELRNTHYLAWIWHRFLPPKWLSDLLRMRFSSCMWASCDRRKSNWRFWSSYIVVKIIMAPCGEDTENIIFHSNWSLTNLFTGYSCAFWFGVCWWPRNIDIWQRCDQMHKKVQINWNFSLASSFWQKAQSDM